MWQSRPGGGTLVVRDDCVLMVLRERSGMVHWELPSGLVDAGESFEQTAVRETLEETGLHVEVSDLLCTVTMIVPAEEYRAVNVYYRATTTDAQEPRVLTPSEPIKNAAFVAIEDLDLNQIHPVDRRILGQWRRDPRQPPFCFTIGL
jgi:8-oxo-dGTP pyrophosphatase MutT (NUDIX family)